MSQNYYYTVVESRAKVCLVKIYLRLSLPMTSAVVCSKVVMLLWLICCLLLHLLYAGILRLVYVLSCIVLCVASSFAIILLRK